MKLSGVIEQRECDADLEAIAAAAGRDAERVLPVPQPELIGDLLLLLAAPLESWPKIDALKNYGWTLFEIAQGPRWQRLRRRLATLLRDKKLRERRDVALRYLSATMARQLAEFAPAEAAGDTAALDAIGLAYYEAVKNARDKSEELANDHALLFAELARRGYGYDFLTETLTTELVDLCLGTYWQEEDHDPRQLEIVHLPGDEEERLPGELFGVRGATVKTREDQLPKIFPSELAPWFLPPRGGKAVGKLLTIDKVLNRGPLITEHFTTTRPLSWHRVLVTLIAAPERAHDYMAAIEAVGRARLAVFHLLFALARKVPHDQVRVDVGLFTRDLGRWQGAAFPLQTVLPRDQAWRNILELDELQPAYFARYKGPHTRRHQVELFPRESDKSSITPGDWIARTMASGVYRAGFIAAFGRAEERRSFLPPASLPLPRLDAETPLVLLGTGEDEDLATEPEPIEGERPPETRARRHAALHRQASVLRGRAFPDLLAATMAPLPLPEATLPELSAEFLEMVIGPRQERAAS